METYWKILERKPGSQLRLTKIDDEIFEEFKQDFPNFDPASTIDEEQMKSKEGKEQWRSFINKFEKKVDDFNFGTMVRGNPKWEYGVIETIFGEFCYCPEPMHVSWLTMPSCTHAILCCGDRKVRCCMTRDPFHS